MTDSRSPERLRQFGKVLVVSWALPPWRTGSAVIVSNLAACFDEHEMVLAGRRPAGYQELEQHNGAPRKYYVTREWTWPRRGKRFVHWIRWLMLPMAVWRLVRIIRQERCTTVLAVFPDEFYLCSAYIAAGITHRQFYPYYHNTYLENRRGVGRVLARWLQKKTFASETVFVMSEGMRQYCERTYLGVRFVPLVHTFTEAVQPSTLKPPGDPLKVAFIGYINDSNLDAMTRCVELIKTRPNCTLTIYGETSAWYCARLGIEGPQFVLTSVPYDKVTEELRKHDVLLLPHGFCGSISEVEYATIFPTRTISYLLAGRPILAHSPPHAFITQWLRERGCAEVVDRPSLEQLEKSLDRLTYDLALREELVRNGFCAVEDFRAAKVVKLLRTHIGQQYENRAQAEIERARLA
jgi:hypothetical protein